MDADPKAMDRARKARYRERHREELRAKARAYAAANRDRRAEASRRWNEANPERRREVGRRWRARNLDKVAEKLRRYAQQNTGKISARRRQRYAENPLPAIEEKHRRRAAHAGAMPTWFGEWDRFVIEEAHAAAKRRTASTGYRWSVDHMVPLRCRLACGLHVAENIQVIPARLNSIKRSRLIYTEPLQWLDFYDGR